MKQFGRHRQPSPGHSLFTGMRSKNFFPEKTVDWPKEAWVIDVMRKTILPGLIDAQSDRSQEMRRSP